MKSSIIAPLYLLLVLLQCCGCLQATKPKTLEVLNRSTLGERQLDAILPDVLFHHSDDTINSELMDHLDNLDVAIDQLSNKSTTDWDELDNNLPRSLIKKKWSWNIFKKRISKKVEKWNELIEATSSINVSSSSNDNTDKNIWRSTKNSNLIAKAHHRLSIMSTHPKIAKWVEKLGVGFNSAYQKALASSIGRKAISNAVFFNTSSSSTRKITRLEHMLATSIPEKDRALIRKDLEKTEEAANSNGLVKRYNHNRSKAMPALQLIASFSIVALIISIGCLTVVPIIIFSVLLIISFIAYIVMSSKYDPVTFEPIEHHQDWAWGDDYDEDDISSSSSSSSSSSNTFSSGYNTPVN